MTHVRTFGRGPSAAAGSRGPARRTRSPAATATLATALAAVLAAVAPSDGQDVPFIRGDTTADATVDLSDPVATLLYLFASAGPPTCLEAANVTADATLDIADPVALLSHLFLGAPPPPAPFPECGLPFDQALPCERFEPCRGDELLEYLELAELLDLERAMADAEALVEGATIPMDGHEVVEIPEELLEALVLLAPGEPVQALRGLPGYEEFFRGSSALAENRRDGWDDSTFAPTVEIEADGDGDPPSLALGGETLAEIASSLAEAGVIGGSDRLSGATPSVVASREPSPVLLRVEGELWAGRYLGCDAIVRPPAVPRRPARIRITQEPRGRRFDGRDDSGATPARCELVTSGVLRRPPRPTEQAESWRWDLLGRGLSRSPELSLEPSAAPNDGWRIVEGPGPSHGMFAMRAKANCASPETATAIAAGGGARASVGLVCFEQGIKDRGGQECAATVRMLGIYRSQVRVVSGAGWGCFPFGTNAIEALAMDQACMTVFRGTEPEPIFSKGVAVQNGTQVASKVSFGAEAGVCYRPAEGPSGDASIRFGYSETVVESTGARVDLLDCHGLGQTTIEPDATIAVELQSNGAVAVNGRRRVIGTARVSPAAAALAFVATSSCAPGVACAFRSCRADQEADLLAELTELFRSSGVCVGWVESP